MVFQRRDERVIQFAMLDHFPTFIFPSLNPDLVKIDDSEWLADHSRQSIEDLTNLMRNTVGELSAQASQRHKELEDALNGGPTTPGAHVFITRTIQMIRNALLYLLSDKFMEDVDLGDGSTRKRWSRGKFHSFVSQIIPRLTVYVAKDGIRLKTPPALWEQVSEDLGAKYFFPNADIVQVNGNHIDFITENTLLKSLQEDFNDAGA